MYLSAISMVVIASAIWVAFDARDIQQRLGLPSGPMNSSPVVWGIAVFFLWIVCFPLYLFQRDKTIRKYRARAGAAAPQRLADDSLARAVLPVGRSGWSIAAGYLGLLSLLVVPAPLALLSGMVALSDLRRNPGRLGKGRATFGVVMGALGTAVLLWLTLGDWVRYEAAERRTTSAAASTLETGDRDSETYYRRLADEADRRAEQAAEAKHHAELEVSRLEAKVRELEQRLAEESPSCTDIVRRHEKRLEECQQGRRQMAAVLRRLGAQAPPG